MNLWEENLLINGKLCRPESNQCYAVINPFSEAVIGHAADASINDTLLAIDAARKAFDDTEWLSNKSLRSMCLKQFQGACLDAKEEIHDIIHQEIGTPLEFAKCAEDLTLAHVADSYLDHLADFNWEKSFKQYSGVSMVSDSMEKMKSVGVLAAMPSVNFPLQIILNKIITALASGCTLVLKAASATPLSTLFLGRLIVSKTDIPCGVINIITSSRLNHIREVFLSDNRVDMISLTETSFSNKKSVSDKDKIRKVVV